MADKKISDLEVLTNTLTPESKLEVSYTDDTITSPVTRAVTVEQIAETVLQEVELASELETEAKNIVDAINEVNEKAEQGGGGGSGTVTDVRVDSKSFLGEDGVVNISLGGQFPQGGGLKVWEASGTQPQRLGIIEPHQMEIINRNSGEMHQMTRAVTLSQLDYAVKRALTDGSGTEYTEEEQAAARERLGITEGGSTVTMADNESGGVDLTVEGTTKTLAKEADLTDVNNALSTKADKENDFVLIEDITLDISTRTITRNTTPSGVSYAFKRVICFVTIPGGSSALGDTDYNVTLVNEANEAHIYRSKFSNTSSQYNLNSSFFADCICGRLFYRTALSTGNVFNVSSPIDSPANIGLYEYHHITQITLSGYGSSSFPSGTNIKILGVV